MIVRRVTGSVETVRAYYEGQEIVTFEVYRSQAIMRRPGMEPKMVTRQYALDTIKDLEDGERLRHFPYY